MPEPEMWRDALRSFTSNSKRVLALSQDESVRMNHRSIGTEHLIIGLGRMTEGGVVDERVKKVYTALGLSLPQLREAVGKIAPRGESATPPIETTLAPATKKAIALAHEEMTIRKKHDLEPVYLLLGVARQSDSIGATALAQCGAAADRVREVVDHELAG
jgi:ATP-dependent Clp protease ATP-binding subunit ClpC